MLVLLVVFVSRALPHIYGTAKCVASEQQQKTARQIVSKKVPEPQSLLAPADSKRTRLWTKHFNVFLRFRYINRASFSYTWSSTKYHPHCSGKFPPGHGSTRRSLHQCLAQLFPKSCSFRGFMSMQPMLSLTSNSQQ